MQDSILLHEIIHLLQDWENDKLRTGPDTDGQAPSKDQGFTTETNPTAGLGVQRDPWGGSGLGVVFMRTDSCGPASRGSRGGACGQGRCRPDFVCFVFLDSYLLSRDLELSTFSGSAFGAVGACFPGMG